MHFPTLVVALGVCGVWAAPVDQQPLVETAGHRAGPHRVVNPYKPGYHDPYDRKVDPQADKLQPLPYVSLSKT